ncbi:glycosyl hydrolase family 18 protein [Niameybacter massiliensis]|uniref:Glycosyl hydrolase family 18 protein n=1 Tax=Holtiella tumoricola TaxID=3018743 RepID=A0AA42DJJ3_9FIRM|nr:glycosyl hydrolase family 18 protein [Holtiella tumoricola]MDA3730104.1 glycosyl hydrolase family 18 protein [Holtiella tumoricola]
MKSIRNALMSIMLISCLVIPNLMYASSQGYMTTGEFVKLLESLDTYRRLEDVSNIEAVLTRKDAANILVKLMGYEGIAKDYENSSEFKDVTQYKGNIALVKELGIMSGVSETTFNPTGKVSKEQADTIYERLMTKLSIPTKWNHAFYAISSSNQMDLIPEYDAISFGWSQVVYDDTNQNFNLESTNGNNDFKIPAGFSVPLDLVKENGGEAYLMIFFEDHNQLAQKLLNDSGKSEYLISQIVGLCNQVSKDGVTRSFDGVTIDFENFISSDLKEAYINFLDKLNLELKKNNKKLNVALQPNIYFKGYDYKGIGQIADKIILMAHDYAPTKLSVFEQELGVVMTPITPINEIYKVLNEITHPVTGTENRDKIVLQISYGSVQWQVKDNKIINAKPYTPSYDKIYGRLNMEGMKGIYNEQYQNAYATYEQEGIKNVIWYENNKSVKAKIDLAKLFGVNNVSYWRLGTIPQYE